MSKQTSVDWLKEVYNTQGRILQPQFDQAKAIEREQIKYAYSQGVFDIVKDLNKVDAEKYYNETYKGEK